MSALLYYNQMFTQGLDFPAPETLKRIEPGVLEDFTIFTYPVSEAIVGYNPDEPLTGYYSEKQRMLVECNRSTLHQFRGFLDADTIDVGVSYDPGIKPNSSQFASDTTEWHMDRRDDLWMPSFDILMLVTGLPPEFAVGTLPEDCDLARVIQLGIPIGSDDIQTAIDDGLLEAVPIEPYSIVRHSNDHWHRAVLNTTSEPIERAHFVANASE